MAIRSIAAFKLALLIETSKDCTYGSGVCRVAENRANIGFYPFYPITWIPLRDMIDCNARDGIEQSQSDTEKTDITVQYIIPAPPLHRLSGSLSGYQ
jgi:hypothetical protein